MRSPNSEAVLVEQVAFYLEVQHPGVIYRFDLAADLKLTMGQAARHKLLHPVRGYPDLFVAKPVMYDGTTNPCAGLFLELKRDGIKLHKRDGSFINPHVAEQAAMLDRLREAGFYAEFAIGFDQAKYYIDTYLNGDIGPQLPSVFGLSLVPTKPLRDDDVPF